MVNSKQKGNGYERTVSNKLSERFAEKTGLEKAFRRNIDSGSFFGATNQKRIETHNTENAVFGDINCPSDFKFCIECKNYKKPPLFSNLLNQQYKEWDDWTKQAKQDSENGNKKMAVIVKYNNVPEFVILEDKLDGVVNIPYKEYFIVSLSDWLKQSDDYFFE